MSSQQLHQIQLEEFCSTSTVACTMWSFFYFTFFVIVQNQRTGCTYKSISISVKHWCLIIILFKLGCRNTYSYEFNWIKCYICTINPSNQRPWQLSPPLRIIFLSHIMNTNSSRCKESVLWENKVRSDKLNNVIRHAEV